MSTLEALQGVTASLHSSQGRERRFAKDSARPLEGVSKLWMAMDAMTVLASAVLGVLYELHTGPLSGAKRFWRGTLISGRPMWILLALLLGFAVAFLAIGRWLGMYSPMRLGSILHEQKLSVEACLVSGLALTGTLYLVRADDIPRRIVLVTLGLVTILVGLRRLTNHILLYRRFERGLGTRKVLIFGTGPEADALRQRLESAPHLGYSFQGFLELPGAGSSPAAVRGEVFGSLESAFQHARKQFVDEIFIAPPCERGTVENLLEQARAHGIDLRIAPDLYRDLGSAIAIEYLGESPTVVFRSGQRREFALFLKRVFDLVFSGVVLAAISPLLVAIAIAVRLDSPGPAFYSSERIGKRGQTFRCFKFRTMVRDAEMRRAEIEHRNERDGVLFKVSDDPRITRLGRLLRKYSLDELPQFFNVLRGEMSVVGPRPPLVDEVQKYELGHLRRLDVTPGVTGLWQVQARQEPSFERYISLDMKYVDNWNFWLDFKIVLRTIRVVVAGTGS